MMPRRSHDERDDWSSEDWQILISDLQDGGDDALADTVKYLIDRLMDELLRAGETDRVLKLCFDALTPYKDGDAMLASVRNLILTRLTGEK